MRVTKGLKKEYKSIASMYVNVLQFVGALFKRMPPLFYTACLCFLFLLLVGIFFAVLESEPQSLTFPFNSTTLFIYIRNNLNALRQNSY